MLKHSTTNNKTKKHNHGKYFPALINYQVADHYVFNYFMFFKTIIPSLPQQLIFIRDCVCIALASIVGIAKQKIFIQALVIRKLNISLLYTKNINDKFIFIFVFL